MSEWMPIETYDALKKKPEHAAFAVKATTPRRSGDITLAAIIVLQRNYGSREVTHWIELPALPK